MDKKIDYKKEIEELDKQDEFESSLLDYYKLIIKVLYSKGRIFYRMKPDTKSDLVNFYKKHKENMVVMCGDGANDCGGILSSDIGKGN